jgi:hypothetical protein
MFRSGTLDTLAPSAVVCTEARPLSCPRGKPSRWHRFRDRSAAVGRWLGRIRAWLERGRCSQSVARRLGDRQHARVAVSVTGWAMSMLTLASLARQTTSSTERSRRSVMSTRWWSITSSVRGPRSCSPQASILGRWVMSWPTRSAREAIQEMTGSLADPLAGAGSTVNAIDPGPNDTGWTSDELREQLAG